EAARDRLQIETVPDARWGESRPRTTDENAGGAPPPLPTVGAALDVADFKYIRPIPGGDPGLVVLPLDASALAHSVGPARQLADLRIVDAGGHQVPFLVERSSEPLSLDVTLERSASPPRGLVDRRGNRSVYRLSLPVDRLPAMRLVLTTSARVFQRVIA